MKKAISLLTRYIPRKYLQLFSGFGLKALGFLYAGNNVFCPVCSHHYKKFLPYGRISVRPNALCPHCLSLERHRLIWVYLERNTCFFKEQLDVLHIAPEPCFMKPFEKQHGDRYITADIESPLAKVKMDIHQIPFPENHFDAILCNHVLEHVRDDIQAITEISRVLKPGGWAILQVPFFSPVPEVTYEDSSVIGNREREIAFGQDDHVRKYGKDYTARIQRGGLHSSAIPFPKTLKSEEVKYYGLQPGEFLFIGSKEEK